VKNSSANLITKKYKKGDDTNFKAKITDTVKESDTKKGGGTSSAVKEKIIEAKDNNSKEGEGKANIDIKVKTTAKQKKANVGGEKTPNSTGEAKKGNFKKDEKSNSNRQVLAASSNEKKRKKSPKIKNMKPDMDATTNTNNEVKNDPLYDEISNFLAKQKKKIMKQETINPNKSSGNDKAAKSTANVGNKKAIEKKRKDEEVSNKTNSVSADNYEKKKVQEKKKDEGQDSNKTNSKDGANFGKKNVIKNKKRQRLGVNSADNNKKASFKRKRETFGQNKSNKKSNNTK